MSDDRLHLINTVHERFDTNGKKTDWVYRLYKVICECPDCTIGREGYMIEWVNGDGKPKRIPITWTKIVELLSNPNAEH